MAGGLFVAAGRTAREAFTTFLAAVRTGRRARAVARTGWHGTSFVLPDETLGGGGAGGDGERVLLQTETAVPHAFTRQGTLADWQAAVAEPARGNSRLILALATALAAPLLHLVGAESGGVHLYGKSSTGKTTCLDAAASVWGGGEYTRTWRATVNGLEGVAAAHSDALLCLDEIGQVDGRIAAEAAYLLGNGVGRVRARRDGSARQPQRWRLLFLSTGETRLADKVAEDGRRRPTAGQEVRVLDVPAEVEGGLGVFEALHGAATAADFADRLRQAAKRCHGTAARAFLARVAADTGRAAALATQFRGRFIAAHRPAGATGQVVRAAERFSLIAAAGELATARNTSSCWRCGGRRS